MYDDTYAGLKRKEAQVMYEIDNRPGCSTSFIADKLDWVNDTGSVSYRVSKLESRGLVSTSRRERTNGFNETTHTLTQRGEKALREALEEYNITSTTEVMEKVHHLEREVQRLRSKVNELEK